MKVWVVTHIGWDNDYVKGIFSTKERAEEYARHYDCIGITCWELDQPAKD